MYKEVYQKWLNSPNIDNNTKEELLAIAENDYEIKERFHKYMSFGTAGLRGIMEAGTDRMNTYTVAKATEGLAQYIKKVGEAAMQRGVVIGYDSRNNSPEFAKVAADVLSSHKIQVYLFPVLHSTPEISFAVRFLSTISGIIITSSHNPKEYNGYKCYWEDGAQMSTSRSAELSGIIDNVDELNLRYTANEDYIHILDEKIDEEYKKAVLKQKMEDGGNLKIVYTPLYGAAFRPVTQILAECGFKNVHVVKEQAEPNGNFPTAPYPNPEDDECWNSALELAHQVDADIALATDPDGDRISVFVNIGGEFKRINGNQVGIILTEYLISEKLKRGVLPENPAVVSTFVSSRLTPKICENYGVTYFDVYTGFKYIAGKISDFEIGKSHNFVYGFEQSIGYLVGTHARDKDATVAAMIISGLAQKLRNEGKTLFDFLDETYKKYGILIETDEGIIRPGINGAEEIANLMKKLRENPPTEIGGIKVGHIIDHLQKPIDPADLIVITLASGSHVSIRPSGTEPKARFYYSAVSQEEHDRIKEGLRAYAGF